MIQNADSSLASRTGEPLTFAAMRTRGVNQEHTLEGLAGVQGEP